MIISLREQSVPPPSQGVSKVERFLFSHAVRNGALCKGLHGDPK